MFTNIKFLKLFNDKFIKLILRFNFGKIYFDIK